MIRMYLQGVGRYSQGVALGYDLVGLSARFLFVWDDDLDWLSVRCPIDWGDDPVGLSARCSNAWDDDLDWLSARCSCDNELAGPSAWLSIGDGKVFVP